MGHQPCPDKHRRISLDPEAQHCSLINKWNGEPNFYDPLARLIFYCKLKFVLDLILLTLVLALKTDSDSPVPKCSPGGGAALLTPITWELEICHILYNLT